MALILDTKDARVILTEDKDKEVRYCYGTADVWKVKQIKSPDLICITFQTPAVP